MDDLLKRVKEELELYPANRQKYYEIREDILHGTIRLDGDSRNQSYASDLTGAKGQKLADLDNRTWVRWVKLIESSLLIMGEYERKLISLRYWNGYRDFRVAMELGIGRTKYFADKDRILYAIQTAAIREGLLK